MKGLERVAVEIYDDDKQASRAVAQEIAEIVRQRAAAGKRAVLGLANRRTVMNLCAELVRMHRAEGLDFSNCVVFNTNEYYPLDAAAAQSRQGWLRRNLLEHINVKGENIHLLDGGVAADKVGEYCRQYKKKIAGAGGVDLQVLAVSNSGHLGFNELDARADSVTRRVRLDNITRKEAASDFFGEENVPEGGLTVGIGTILKARRICLLAFGEHKAQIIRRLAEGRVTDSLAASALQKHGDVTFYLGQASAAELTRVATPWLVGSCRWSEQLKRRAVLWLAQKLNKAILKLTAEDYTDNGLAELLRLSGGCYDLNISIFRQQMNTITGWPGGKDGAKKILVFSPHPDDDVISMGGTLIRVVERKHDVHAAYMVSGYQSVFDHNVVRYANFVREFNRIFKLDAENTARMEEHIDRFLVQKKAGDADTGEIRTIKTLIRRMEAIDAATYCGVKEDRIHFLELPFYDTGNTQRQAVGVEDIAIVQRLLKEVGPDIIFAAGDLSDPHGTHRLCLDALFAALAEYVKGGGRPQLWLYRGAWQEWGPEEVDMAVPLSPDELKRKRYAIFRHESQKDRAMFPGPYDSREFWQRAEERNITTARIYDALGLPEYHAMESFVRWPLERLAKNEQPPSE